MTRAPVRDAEVMVSELLRLIEYLGDKITKLDAYAYAANHLVHEISVPAERDRRSLDRLVHLLADITDVAALTVDDYHTRLASVLAQRRRGGRRDQPRADQIQAPSRRVP